MDSTRGKMLLSKVVKAKSFAKNETSHPTSSALKFHSYRSYYQVMKCYRSSILAIEWGCMKINSKCSPKANDQLPVLGKVLKLLTASAPLTHYSPMLFFHTPGKHQKTFRFKILGVANKVVSYLQKASFLSFQKHLNFRRSYY